MKTLLPLLLLPLLATGCLAMRMAPDVEDTDDLLAYLHDEGIATDATGLVTQPPLTEEGHEYRLIGSDVLLVFEYPYEEKAQIDAARLSRFRLDATDLHVYHRDRLIVLYRGRNVEVKLALGHALGPKLV